jgi:ABC-type amino acid transport system permease subunit
LAGGVKGKGVKQGLNINILNNTSLVSVVSVPAVLLANCSVSDRPNTGPTVATFFYAVMILAGEG